MREQVCVYMCPWPRIQAALTDEYALNVTYRYDRGEPRASVKKAAALHAARRSPPATASIVCNASMSARPASTSGNGPNLGCIQCGLCIDACDAVMAKIGRPPRLIAYDTDINIKRRQAGPSAVLSHRAHAHGALCGDHRRWSARMMAYTLATRRNDGVAVIHDRNPLFVRLADGAVRNAYARAHRQQDARPEEFWLRSRDSPTPRSKSSARRRARAAIRSSRSAPTRPARSAFWSRRTRSSRRGPRSHLTFTIVAGDRRHRRQRQRPLPRTVRR